MATKPQKKNKIQMPLFNMAFAKRQEVKDAPTFDKYIGVALCHLEAVNPTAEELSKILGRESTVSEATSKVEVNAIDGTKKEGKQVMLSFWFSFQNGDEKVFINHKVYLKSGVRFKTDKSKIQIVDGYGRFAWATIDEYKGNVIPMYTDKNTGQLKPANICKKYRAALDGEEELITAIIALLGLNKPSKKVGDTFVSLTDEELEQRADEFACGFEAEDIRKILEGNVKPIRDAINERNEVKVILGVSHKESGDWQDTYKYIYKKNYNLISKVEADIKDSIAKGYSVSEFLVDDHIPLEPIKYEVKATNLNSSKATASARPAASVEPPKSDDLPF